MIHVNENGFWSRVNRISGCLLVPILATLLAGSIYLNFKQYDVNKANIKAYTKTIEDYKSALIDVNKDLSKAYKENVRISLKAIDSHVKSIKETNKIVKQCNNEIKKANGIILFSRLLPYAGIRNRI